MCKASNVFLACSRPRVCVVFSNEVDGFEPFQNHPLSVIIDSVEYLADVFVAVVSLYVGVVRSDLSLNVWRRALAGLLITMSVRTSERVEESTDPQWVPFQQVLCVVAIASWNSVNQ